MPDQATEIMRTNVISKLTDKGKIAAAKDRAQEYFKMLNECYKGDANHSKFFDELSQKF